MSDPVSNADIEDVLSSIRRLVSEEPCSNISRGQQAEDGNVERFVLTPALRVSEEDRPDAADTPDTPPTGQPQQPVETADPAPQAPEGFEATEDWSDNRLQYATEAMTEGRVGPEAHDSARAARAPADLSLEERIAELEAAIERAPQEWEPDGSEDGSSDESRPLSYDAGSDGDDIADMVLAVGSEQAEPDQPEATQQDPETVETGPEADLADLLELVSSTQTADEDGSPEPEPEFESSRRVGLADDHDPQPDAELAEDHDAPQPETGAEDQPDADDAAVDWLDFEAETEADQDDTAEISPGDETEGTLSAWEEPLTAQEAFEPTAPTEMQESEAAGTEVDADEDDDAIEAEQMFGGDANHAAASLDSEHDNLLSDDEALTLDEDALRELVSDMVRQELQGVLGERITRNVRRLVRREIQRALALRDLE